MRRREREDPDGLTTLLLGMAGAVWRCRLELALAGLLVLPELTLAGLVGDVVAIAALVTLAGVAVWVPASRRWLLRALRAAWMRRAWWRAWTDCELPRQGRAGV